MGHKRRTPRKTLFAGLSVDLPTGPEMYADHFYRQRAALSKAAELKTPATPPNRRVMPGDRPSWMPVPADIKLLTTRGRNGVRESVGTTSVPTRTRKTPGERIDWGKADGKRRSRSLVGHPTRAKDAEKVIYSSRTGMSARPVTTREQKLTGAEIAASQEYKRLHADAVAAEKARAAAQTKLHDAIGRERDALSRGDSNTAESARAEIRALRKMLKGA